MIITNHKLAKEFAVFDEIRKASGNVSGGLPDTGHETIADPLYRNTDVAILDEKKDWYQVEVKIRGWVPRKFVIKADSDKTS